jgi:DNA-binding NtrC family response regulator
MSQARILIVDSGENSCVRGNCGHLRTLVERAYPRSAEYLSATFEEVGGHTFREPDLVVFRAAIDFPLSQVVSQLRRQWKAASMVGVVCQSSEASTNLAEQLFPGLDDFFCCPIRELEWDPRIRRLLPAEYPKNENREGLKLDSLIGESAVFLAAIEKIPRLANSDATVLITGETGTGKELFARAMHYNGARRGNPFVPLNCGALPDHLFENELFGHARGAYTDAGQVQTGLLAEAEGGTLFLDEVDTLSKSAQTKLLRFLQDREYRPLGSPKSLQANVRTIGATNADLRELVRTHCFRGDLFHRLNILTVEVPALRSRTEDIPRLAQYFLTRYAAQYQRRRMVISRGALSRLENYAWPGNVRELENLIHRAVVIAPLDVLRAQDIELPGLEKPPQELDSSTLQEAKARVISEFERSYLSHLLLTSQGNVSQAARAAGTDRRALQRMIRKHGLAPLSFRLS